MGQRRLGIREADDGSARARHAAAALALVSRAARTSDRDEWLLAAQSFSRLVESFPDDTLADDAALEAARVLPEAVAQAGARPDVRLERARRRYNTLLGLYPDSPLAPTGAEGARRRSRRCSPRRTTSRGCTTCGGRRTTRRSSTSRTSSRSIPTTPTAQDAQLRLVEAYKAIQLQGRRAGCVRGAAHAAIPDDAEVRTTCAASRRRPTVASSTAADSTAAASRRPRAPADPLRRAPRDLRRELRSAAPRPSARRSIDAAERSGSTRVRVRPGRGAAVQGRDARRPRPADRLAMTERLVGGDPRLLRRSDRNRPGRVILHG